jgi:endonuclease YncB( thermonuclease family)
VDTFENFPMGYEAARSIGCFRAWCTRVVDGDTYDFILDLGLTVRVKDRIRLYGFDTAEFFHPRNDAELLHAKQAIEVVSELIADKPCLVRTYRTRTGTDVVTVGRYVADVYYLKDGLWSSIIVPMQKAGLEKKDSY